MVTMPQATSATGIPPAEAAPVEKTEQLPEATSSTTVPTEETDPKVAEANQHKEEGNVFLRDKKRAEAIASYTKAIELVPTEAVYWSNRSVAYFQSGQAENALADAEESIRLRPDWGKAYSRKANALQLLHRHDEAMDVCRLGLEKEPGYPLLVNVLEKSCRLRLKGRWVGTTSIEVGGYEQDMDFLTPDQSTVNVTVMGRTLSARIHVDVKTDPISLDIAMPSPGSFAGPTIVPHIIRFTDEGLDIAGPFMTTDRPTSFEGPGVVTMRRPENVSEENKIKRVEGLTEREEMLLYMDGFMQVFFFHL